METPILQNTFDCFCFAFSAIDMPRFSLIPTEFIGDGPVAPGQIVKIFQCIRKIYQDLTGINCTYSDFINYGGALGDNGFSRYIQDHPNPNSEVSLVFDLDFF